VDAFDDVGMRVVPELGTRAVREAGGEEHRAVPAIEDEQFAGSRAREALLASGRAHLVTMRRTPST